jgi:adenosylcobinamide kinase/adenosylcobinamide-phosphate guanylyltransferase
MGRIVLVTGGSRSGKSKFAEQMAKAEGNNVLYIATAIPIDDEMKHRIKMHRNQRPKEWVTLEAYKDLDTAVKPIIYGKDAVLLDCVTVMITNLMFDNGEPDWDFIKQEEITRIEDNLREQFNKLINLAGDSDVPFFLVTNELGMGLVPEYPLGRIYRDIAGRINQNLAAAAEQVYLCVSGIPVKIKG